MNRKRAALVACCITICCCTALGTIFDFTGGLMLCEPAAGGDCYGDWDVDGNWIYDCPLPPPQLCGLEHPDSPADEANIEWETNPAEGGNYLSIDYPTYTVGPMRVSIPSHPEFGSLGIKFGSKDETGNTLTCSSISFIATNGKMIVRVIDEATLKTN